MIFHKLVFKYKKQFISINDFLYQKYTIYFKANFNTKIKTIKHIDEKILYMNKMKLDLELSPFDPIY